MNRLRLIATCALMCLSTTSFAHEEAKGVVKERMDRFKENKEAMKAIKGNLSDDAAVIAQKASEIEAWANEMVNFFPEGSNQAPSEALPIIWKELGRFTELANANAKAAANLKTLAQSGADINTLINGFKALGKTCKDCHNDFKE
jgi:cytochrome c556